MRSKKISFVVLLSLVLFLLIFFVFSGTFSNSPKKITANIINEIQIKDNSIFESTCYDSDGTNYYEKGYRDFKGNLQEEFCLKVESTGKMYVKEYYCYGEFVQECPGDCVDGACISENENKKLLSNFVGDIKGFFIKVI